MPQKTTLFGEIKTDYLLEGFIPPKEYVEVP